MLYRLFKAHPASVGESYSQHCGFAFAVGLRMIGAGLACVLHGLLPFLFVHTGSTCIRELSANLGTRRPRSASAETDLPTSTPSEA
jgi:hypothetical protein